MPAMPQTQAMAAATTSSANISSLLFSARSLILRNENQQADAGVDPEEDGECDFHGVVVVK